MPRAAFANAVIQSFQRVKALESVRNLFIIFNPQSPQVRNCFRAFSRENPRKSTNLGERKLFVALKIKN